MWNGPTSPLEFASLKSEQDRQHIGIVQENLSLQFQPRVPSASQIFTTGAEQQDLT